MKFKQQICYSKDSEEVVYFRVKRKKIDEKYKYTNKNPFYKIFSFIVYRIIATPIVWFCIKCVKRVKFKNKHLLKQHKKSGYFVYANHTNQFLDGFAPALLCFPQKPRIIVNADNVSVPFIGWFTRLAGALPLPDTLNATKNFNFAINETLQHTNPIIIYPEAHLWPYYTKIRKFNSSSFRYPAVHNKPVFTFTTTYLAPNHGKKPKVEIWVDGPFFINPQLERKAAQEELKTRVYNTMCERAKLSDYEYVNYVKKECNND